MPKTSPFNGLFVYKQGGPELAKLVQATEAKKQKEAEIMSKRDADKLTENKNKTRIAYNKTTGKLEKMLVDAREAGKPYDLKVEDLRALKVALENNVSPIKDLKLDEALVAKIDAQIAANTKAGKSKELINMNLLLKSYKDQLLAFEKAARAAKKGVRETIDRREEQIDLMRTSEERLKSLKNNPRYDQVATDYDRAVSGLLKDPEFKFLSVNQGEVENQVKATQYRQLFLSLIYSQSNRFNDFILGPEFGKQKSAEQLKKDFPFIYKQWMEKEAGTTIHADTLKAQQEVAKVASRFEPLKKEIRDPLHKVLKFKETNGLPTEEDLVATKNSAEARAMIVRIKEVEEHFNLFNANKLEPEEGVAPSKDDEGMLHTNKDLISRKLEQYLKLAKTQLHYLGQKEKKERVDKKFSYETIANPDMRQDVMQYSLRKFAKAKQIVESVGEGQFNPHVKRHLIALIYRYGVETYVGIDEETGAPKFEDRKKNYSSVLSDIAESDEYNSNNTRDLISDEKLQLLTMAIRDGGSIGKELAELHERREFNNVYTEEMKAYLEAEVELNNFDPKAVELVQNALQPTELAYHNASQNYNPLQRKLLGQWKEFRKPGIKELFAVYKEYGADIATKYGAAENTLLLFYESLDSFTTEHAITVPGKVTKLSLRDPLPSKTDKTLTEAQKREINLVEQAMMEYSNKTGKPVPKIQDLLKAREGWKEFNKAKLKFSKIAVPTQKQLVELNKSIQANEAEYRKKYQTEPNFKQFETYVAEFDRTATNLNAKLKRMGVDAGKVGIDGYLKSQLDANKAALKAAPKGISRYFDRTGHISDIALELKAACTEGMTDKEQAAYEKLFKISLKPGVERKRVAAQIEKLEGIVPAIQEFNRAKAAYAKDFELLEDESKLSEKEKEANAKKRIALVERLTGIKPKNDTVAKKALEAILAERTKEYKRNRLFTNQYRAYNRMLDHLRDPESTESKNWLREVSGKGDYKTEFIQTRDTNIMYESMELHSRGQEHMMQRLTGLKLEGIFAAYEKATIDNPSLKTNNWWELLQSDNEGDREKLFNLLETIIPDDKRGGKRDFMFLLKNAPDLMTQIGGSTVQENDAFTATYSTFAMIKIHIEARAKTASRTIKQQKAFEERLKGKGLSDYATEYVGGFWKMLSGPNSSPAQRIAAGLLFYLAYRTGRKAFGDQPGIMGNFLKLGLGVMAVDVLKKGATGKGLFESAKLMNIDNEFEGTDIATLIKHGRENMETGEIPINEEQHYEAQEQIKKVPFIDLMKWYQDVISAGEDTVGSRLKPGRGESDPFKKLKPRINTRKIYEKNKIKGQDKDLVGRMAVFKTLHNFFDYVGKKDGQDADYGMKALQERWINPINGKRELAGARHTSWFQPKSLTDPFINNKKGLTFEHVMHPEMRQEDVMKTIDDNWTDRGVDMASQAMEAAKNWTRREVVPPAERISRDILDKIELDYGPRIKDWVEDMYVAGKTKVIYAKDRVVLKYEAHEVEIWKVVDKHVDLFKQGASFGFKAVVAIDGVIIDWADANINRLTGIARAKFDQREIPIPLVNGADLSPAFFEKGSAQRPNFYRKYLGERYAGKFEDAYSAGELKLNRSSGKVERTKSMFKIDDLPYSKESFEANLDTITEVARAEGSTVTREQIHNAATELLKKVPNNIAYYVSEVTNDQVESHITDPVMRKERMMRLAQEQAEREMKTQMMEKHPGGVYNKAYFDKYLANITMVPKFSNTGQQPEKIYVFYRMPMQNSFEYTRIATGEQTDYTDPRKLKDEHPFIADPSKGIIENLKEAYAGEIGIVTPAKRYALMLLGLGFGIAGSGLDVGAGLFEGFDWSKGLAKRMRFTPQERKSLDEFTHTASNRLTARSKFYKGDGTPEGDLLAKHRRNAFKLGKQGQFFEVDYEMESDFEAYTDTEIDLFKQMKTAKKYKGKYKDLKLYGLSESDLGE